jgi:hypothetical protein
VSSSTPTDDCTTLAEFVRLLVGELARADYPALERLRAAVDDRCARITLDDESIEVWFTGEELAVADAPGRDVDGEGATVSSTVHDLLDGQIEVLDAILDGRLDVTGPPEDIHRIFVAIEILLDASARAPGLQELARRFRADPCRGGRGAPLAATRMTPWFPPRAAAAEEALLARLGLLPGSA